MASLGLAVSDVLQSVFSPSPASVLNGSTPHCEPYFATEKLQWPFDPFSALWATQGSMTIVISGWLPAFFTSVMNLAESASPISE